MLRQSLKPVCAGDPSILLAEANIDPQRRAEEIDVAGFVALARALKVAREK
jgi:16S rRNA (adenine1518-N6/adenine1519-N6)-dimethyltransferase